ncbi:hypothetical protein XELAEV_18030647mg [Xenopus laevis]|uniref:Uncharacterized protein n=1 Tax=Xenopus laevis TaxID=8355 RepID=A0A974HF02_XENLA|nr:hypothetical protein XELAEV_18030647mg [Xenopus laevis]
MINLGHVPLEHDGSFCSAEILLYIISRNSAKKHQELPSLYRCFAAMLCTGQ